MINKEQAEGMRGYYETIKSYTDLMVTWNHQALEGVKGLYTSEGGKTETADVWKIFPDWEQAGEGMNRMLEAAPLKAGAIKEMNKDFLKETAAFQRFQDEWLDCWVLLGRKGYEAGVDFLVQEGPDVGEFVKTVDLITQRLEGALNTYLEDTPYSELATVSPAFRNVLDAFSEEKKTATAVWEDWVAFQRKAANLWKTAAEEWISGEKTSSGELYGTADGVRRIISEYGSFMKSVFQKIDIPEEVKTQFESRVEESAQLSDQGLDAALSLMQTAANFQRALVASTQKLFSFSNGHRRWTGEDRYRDWRAQYETFVRETIRNGRVTEGMTESVAAAAELTRVWRRRMMNILIPPCVPADKAGQEKAFSETPRPAVAESPETP